MSATLNPDSLTLADKRAAFNPFDGCPWIDYFEELTWGYMQREDREWSSPGPHHERWFDTFESGTDKILLAHRGSLKTTSTLSYVIANLEHRSGFHAAWIGNNETLAYEKAHSEFNKLVSRNAWLTTLQEDRRATDQKGKKEFANDSSLSVGWLFGGVEGRHVDLLVVDDLIKEKGDGDMQEIEDWLSSVIVPVQEHGGQTIVIGTRKTPTDVYSLLADREGFAFTEYPAILGVWDSEFGEEAPERRPDPAIYHRAPHPLDSNRDCQLLWRERGTDYLRDARSKQSEHAFMREFCLVVQTREGAVYDTFDTRQHTTDNEPDLQQIAYWFNGLDWGSGHPAGILCMAKTRNDHVYVLDEVKKPASGTGDYVDTLTSFHNTYGTGVVGCDPSDKRGIDDLRNEGFDAVASDNDIESGIRVVEDLLVQNRLHIHERCTDLIQELTTYRYNQTTGKPVKKNDHLADALRYALMTDRYHEEDDEEGFLL